LQRDDLNPVEHAMGIRQLMAQYQYTQETVAERLGSSRSAVANMLRLLTLPDEVLDMLRGEVLTAGHARALVTLRDKQAQLKLAETAAAQGWSVRQLERICAGHAVEKPRPPQKEIPRRAAELNELEKMARDVFGTRAKIEGDAEKGRLVLEYFSPEDLQRIYEILDFMRQGG
jgi:ParB family chromosome partitioning protein